MRPRRALGSLGAAALAGCRGAQSMLDPAGPQARAIDSLWWLFVAVCAAVWVLVMIALVAAVARSRRAPAATGPDLAPAGEARHGVVVGVAVLATVVLLFVLAGSSFSIGRVLSTLPSGEAPVSIRVTGHQWWWELRYESATPSDIVTTANEMHLPAGRPIYLTLSSVDVIHSLWIPSLQGKRDLVPGHTTNLVLVADRPGTYRGQCAEFCGVQHAHMALDVVVEPPERFDAWLAAQRAPAASPATPEEEHGRQVFLAARCPMCHTVLGTDAAGRVGPDLTHFASRRSLAAGSVPNSRGHRAGWILDPHAIKPGARMPTNELAPEDFHALLAYLDRLK